MKDVANVDWTHFGDKNKWDKINQPCLHPQHSPPGYMVIPEEGYTHTCPCCGKKQHIHTNRVFM